MTKERLLADIPAEVAAVSVVSKPGDASGANVMKGYASVFDYPIESGTRSHSQTTFVRAGAFKRTLNNNRDMIQSLFNHGMDPRYGQLPIGRITRLEENDRGLWGEVELHRGPDNENIRAALAQGALRAMSIQFEVINQTFNEDRTERNLEEVRLWEFGPVTFPANEAATATLHSAALWLPSTEPEPFATGARAPDGTPKALPGPRTIFATRLTLVSEDLERQGAEFQDALEREMAWLASKR